MADNQIGDVRIINHPGHIRKTLKGVSKYGVGEMFQIKQVYTVKRSFKLLGKDMLECSWVDVEWVE